MKKTGSASNMWFVMVTALSLIKGDEKCLITGNKEMSEIYLSL